MCRVTVTQLVLSGKVDIAGVRTGAALKSSLQPGNWGRACAGLEQSWEQGVLVGIRSEVFSLAAESR